MKVISWLANQKIPFQSNLFDISPGDEEKDIALSGEQSKEACPGKQVWDRATTLGTGEETEKGQLPRNQVTAVGSEIHRKCWGGCTEELITG